MGLLSAILSCAVGCSVGMGSSIWGGAIHRLEEGAMVDPWQSAGHRSPMWSPSGDESLVQDGRQNRIPDGGHTRGCSPSDEVVRYSGRFAVVREGWKMVVA